MNNIDFSPGDRAPDFSLPDQQGNIVTLKQFLGQWVVNDTMGNSVFMADCD